MSELEKAKQEVEQVCFAYDKAGDTGDIKDWKEYYDLENKLIEKVKIANQPQLTIPKSIADEVVTEGIDAYVIQTSLPSNSYLIPEWEPLVDLSDNLIKWCETTEKWWAILDAYLAGKALGVDLAKVVADD